MMSANVSYSNVIQLSVLAVALGGYVALTIWAYSDIWIRGGRKTIYTNSHFFLVIGIVLTGIWLTEITHFFLLLANLQNTGLALYKRHLRVGLVTAMGIHQTICNYFNINLGVAFMSLQFMGVSLLISVGTLTFTHSWTLSFVYQKWIHLTLGLLVTTLLLLTSCYQRHQISPISMLATKVVILYQLFMLMEAASSLMIGLICLPMESSECGRTYVRTIEDLVLPLFPITYLLMLRQRNLSQWVFKCLNDNGGAQHRLPSENFDDNGHEMQGTISLAFPSTVFSVVSGDEDEEDSSSSQNNY